MPHREASGPTPFAGPDATRLEAVDRLRHQPSDPGPPRRAPKRVAAKGDSTGLWRSDGGSVHPTPAKTETQAKNLSLRLLADHPHTRADLVAILTARGFPPTTIDQALDDLTALGLLDRSLAETAEDAPDAPTRTAAPHPNADAGRPGRNARGGKSDIAKPTPETIEGDRARSVRPGQPDTPGGTPSQAKDACLRLLADGISGRSALTNALAGRGFAPEVIASALNHLTTLGLLNLRAAATTLESTFPPEGDQRPNDTPSRPDHHHDGERPRGTAEGDASGDPLDQVPDFEEDGFGAEGRASEHESRSAARDPETRGRRRRGRGHGTGAPDGESEPRGGGTEAQAKDICLRLLTDRARSRAELAKKLADKGFAEAVAERALNRLAEVGLIDDAAFAEQWVYSRHTYSGRGRKALAEELRRKGVAPEHAEPALASITPAAERDRATELVHRKLQTLPGDLDRDKAIRRLVGMLARRGFDPATAHTVVLAVISEAALPSEPREPAPTAPNAGQPAPADSAADLVERKLRTLPRDLDRDKAIRRLVGMLARRGYDSATAHRVVRSAVDDAGLRQPPTQADTPAAASGNDFDEAAALDLIRRKLRNGPPAGEREKTIRRLVGMLARRGYNQSAAYALVKAELAE